MRPKLEAVYACDKCDYEKIGVNVDECPDCGSTGILPLVDIEDLRIFPKVMQMALFADQNDCHLVGLEILSRSSETQAQAIMLEAKEFLLSLLLDYNDGEPLRSMSNVPNVGNLKELLDLGKEIGRIAQSIGVLNEYK